MLPRHIPVTISHGALGFPIPDPSTVVVVHARVLFGMGRDELPAHTALTGFGCVDLHRRCAVDERGLDELLTDSARVRPAENVREVAGVLLGKLYADDGHAVAEEPVKSLGEAGQLVDQQDVDFGALILKRSFSSLRWPRWILGPIPEPNFILDDGAEAVSHSRRASHKSLEGLPCGS